MAAGMQPALPASARQSIMRQEHALLATAIALAPFLSGCLIGSHSRTELVGRHVPAATLAQIQPGCTKEFVLALAGEPTVRTTVDPRTELWKWSGVERVDSRGHVIFLISSENRTETERTTFVEFRDGVVTRAWGG